MDEATRAWRASLSPTHTGRPPRWRWEDHREWIGVVLRRLSRTNAADGELSMTEAVWSSLAHPLTPPGLSEALRTHKTRFSYPPSLRAILRFVATRIASHARGADRADLTDGLTGRGFLRRHWREERRLRAGEQLSFDDGSINLVCWVDWPWGGAGKVSERWGCIVGRFQFLLCEDAGGHPVGQAGTIPEELLSSAIAIVRWRVIGRLPVKSFATEVRRKEYEDAIAELKDVATGKFAISFPSDPAEEQPRPPAEGAWGSAPKF